MKDGARPSPAMRYHVSKISRAEWPLHLRHSLVIKHDARRQLREARIFPALRSLLARLFSLPSRSALSRFTLPETPMPAEPLIRVLETFDLQREYGEPEHIHSETE